MIRFCLASLFLIGFVFSAYTQTADRPNYQLLWKISGKGLKEPSFLFGTMHVRDNRAFAFSDSVLLALHSCQVFAMEVHPDSMAAQVMSLLYNSSKEKKRNHFREMLSDRDYQQFDSLLRSKYQLSLEDFDTSSELSYALLNRFEKKDQDAFLDMWLYETASAAGKRVIGLETLGEQNFALETVTPEDIQGVKNFFTEDDGNVKQYFDRMFDTYASGDIDKLHAMSVGQTSKESYQSMVVDRNVVMAERLIQSMKQRSTFAAVGAAHLPGKYGVIQLLRTQGYRVTRVHASFTRPTKELQLPRKKWTNFVDEEAGYAIEMPAPPVDFKVPSFGVPLKASVDLGAQSFYMTGYFPLPSKKEIDHTQMFDRITQSYGTTAKGVVDSVRTLLVGGKEARELFVRVNGISFRMRIVAGEKRIYFIACGPTIQDERVEHFFASFRMMEPKINRNTHVYTSKEGAFSLEIIGAETLRLTTPEVPGTGRRYQIHVGHSVDPATGTTYIFRYNDLLTGYSSTDDSLFLVQSVDEITKSLRTEELEKRLTSFGMYPACDFSFLKGNEAVIKGRAVLRGNRYYMLMAVIPSEQDSAVAFSYLRSLRFTPFLKSELSLYKHPHFNIQLPKNFAADSAVTVAADDDMRYSFRDEYTGTMLTVIDEEVSPYAEVDDVPAYFETLARNLFGNDSILAAKEVRGAAHEMGYEYQSMDGKSHAMRRLKILIAGRRVTSLWGVGDPAIMEGELVNQMFDSFTTTPDNHPKITEDKTPLLLKDLMSQDTVVAEAAREALRDHDFERRDVDGIFEVLRTTIKDDNEYFSIRGYLFSVLPSLSDERTFAFISTLYPSLPIDGPLRDKALNSLVSFKKEDYLREVFRIIQEDKSEHRFDGYQVFRPLYDSISLLNATLPNLVLLKDRLDDKGIVLNLMARAFRDSTLADEMRPMAIRTALEWSREAADAAPDSYEDYWQVAYPSLNVLQSIPFTPGVGDLLRKIIGHKDVSINAEAIPYLLKNNGVVKKDDVNEVASNSYYRNSFYYSLQELHQEKLIDKKYRSDRSLAESVAYGYVTDEEEADSVVFHAHRRIKVKEGEADLYLFKFQYDDAWYYLAVGPYNLPRKSTAKAGSEVLTLYDQYADEDALDTALDEQLHTIDMSLVRKARKKQ